MKLEITKIPRDSVTIEYSGDDIVVRVAEKIVCKFKPTDPTGFYMTVGEFDSYSNETQMVVIKDAFEGKND